MPFDKGYRPWNKGGSSWNAGKSFSEESKKKMSEAHKGKVPWNKGISPSEETRNKHAQIMKAYFQTHKHPLLGRKMPKEAIEKMKKSRAITLLDPEVRRKLGESHKGQIPWNKGISPSEETRNKISIANKGRESWLGKKHSEESKKKMSKFHKGKRISEETRNKMSLAYKKRGSNPEERARRTEAQKKALATPEARERMRIEGIKAMSNPETRRKLLEIRTTPEARERSRVNILRLFESGKFSNVQNTRPERMVKEELLRRGHKEGLDFVHQYKFMNKFMCDFCFPQQKVIIEVNGDYWHANPKKYLGKELHPQQNKSINKDKAKEAYITTVDNRSWTYIVLWENEVYTDVVRCVDRVEKALKNKPPVADKEHI